MAFAGLARVLSYAQLQQENDELRRENALLRQKIGTLQCDAYSAYRSFTSQHQNPITLAGCWAHARRNFYEARDHAPSQAGFILRQIAHLYRVEAGLRIQQTSPKLRAVVRAAQSQPIINRIRLALLRWKVGRRFLPRSTMGKAIDYALAHATLLEVYLRDGRVEIDNNLVENAIRPTAIGKKNWLFIGDAQAGQRSAILYTLIECCRRRSLNPFLYLRDVLSRLPSMTNWQVKEVTPKAWADKHPPAPLQLAS